MKFVVHVQSLMNDRLFTLASELFTDAALLWYRGISDTVTCWNDLKKELLEEFLPTDYNLRLMNEIQARTQGVNESFSSYFSVMLNFFKRLLEPLSEKSKLEILMRNIRPEYSEHLALVKIESLSELKEKCKLIEKYKIKSQLFVEPPKVSASTLASDLAYKPNKSQQVAAVTVPQSVKMFCRRCRVNTHNLNNCTAPRKKVCFRCGLAGYTTVTCPSCNKNKNNDSKN